MKKAKHYSSIFINNFFLIETRFITLVETGKNLKDSESMCRYRSVEKQYAITSH